jgi:hypothetical protein
MLLDPMMGQRSSPRNDMRDDIPWGIIALVLAVATILILLVGCQAPLRT